MVVMEETERFLSGSGLDLENFVDQGQGDEEDMNVEDGAVKVVKINLRQEYMKIQKKRVEGSQQRIEDGLVYFTVFSLMQILNVRTFVQRLEDWLREIACNKSENGWSELYTRMVRQKLANYDYVADLDSVYESAEGNQVYGLFKNKGDSIKNSYVFFVMIELLDGKKEFCWSFVLKTKPVKK